MIVRLTANLAKRIRVSPVDALPLAENPFVDWTCRVFSVRDGESLMLITNTASLYSLLTPAHGLENRERFGYGLILYLKRHLLNDRFREILKKYIEPELDSMLLTKSLNRSVTGSMTDMVKLVEFSLVEDGYTLERIATGLNETPFKALDYRHPRGRFAELATVRLGPKE